MLNRRARDHADPRHFLEDLELEEERQQFIGQDLFLGILDDQLLELSEPQEPAPPRLERVGEGRGEDRPGLDAGPCDVPSGYP